MGNSYTTNRAWSDKMIPYLKQIIGGYLLDIASEEDDMKKNTDLIVLNVGNKRIACRVRRNEYWKKQEYRQQFTIRSVNNGYKTELEKVMEGWGDYFFYGFANEDCSAIIKHIFIDLAIFRLHANDTHHMDIPNGDRTYFRAYDWTIMPQEMIFRKNITNDDVGILEEVVSKTIVEPISFSEIKKPEVVKQKTLWDD